MHENKKYTYQEALIIVGRERHSKIFAQHLTPTGIGMVSWENNEIRTTHTDREIPKEGWIIEVLAGYIYDLFNEFRCQLGAKELIYEDFKGQEHVYRYGSEKEVQFNRIMQQRWYLRDTTQQVVVVTGGRSGRKKLMEEMVKLHESGEVFNSDHWIFKKGAITGRMVSDAIANSPGYQREYLGQWGEELVENTSDKMKEDHRSNDDGVDALRYFFSDGGQEDVESEHKELPRDSKEDR